jgi:hypothetical protein
MASLFRPSLLLLASCFAFACDDSEPITVTLPCDIRDADCRSSVFRETASVRAQKGARQPPSRIISRETFAIEQGSELAGEPTPSREDQAFEQSLKLLHFLPEESSFGGAAMESELAGVAAYYDPEDRAVTIIADAVEGDPEEGTKTLAHEYVHALQDQREGLDRVMDAARTTDEIMAVRAYFEGEATVLEDVVLARALNARLELGNLRTYFDRYLLGVLLAVEESEAPLNMGILALPYPIGGRPLGEAFLAGGIGAVQTIYRSRPSTLVGWNDVMRASELPMRPSCLTPDAPPGYSDLGIDSLGTTALIALYTRIGLSGEDAFDAARDWTGDAFAMFVSDEGDVTAALAWRIRMRDAAAAAELQSLVQASDLGAEVALDGSGNEVVITASDAPGLLASWAARNGCSADKALRGTKSLLPKRQRFFARVGARGHDTWLTR